MFWKKVECDGCGAKLKERAALSHRGSYFCNPACRDSWEVKNPPRMAKGDPAELRRILIHTINAALQERERAESYGGAGTDLLLRQIPLAGATMARNNDTDRSEASTRFTEYTHECIPIVRALGYAEETAVLETYGFGGKLPAIIAALQSARDRAAREGA